MWKEILLLNGTFLDTNGNDINEEKLFKLLSDNGYEYEGGYEKIKFTDINEAINMIDKFITEDVLKTMISKLVNFYGEFNSEDIEQFFSESYGTSLSDGLFLSVLNEDLKEVYKKYTRTNWKVSDEFTSRLGDIVLEKINKGDNIN